MSGFNLAPQLRPRPCIGSLLDIPAGRYHKGAHGDMILNGGFSNFIGVGGRGNTFKTALSLSQSIIVLDRYSHSTLTVYDTEITFSWDRIEDISSRWDIDYNEAVDQGRISLTSAAEHSGNEWWSIIRDISKERAKNAKKEKIDTPFVNKDNQPIKAFPPQIHLLDSMSQLETDAISGIYDKNQIDDSAANTDALRGGAIKTRMVMQVPQVTSQGGITLIATAHVGDEFQLDPYAPKVKKLQFMKNGVKFKNVPEKFTFLSSVCWYVSSATPLINQSTKAAEYPLAGYNEHKGDTDLQELVLTNVRNKHGQTGQTLNLIISQTEGLLPSLSEYHYLKSRKDKFGLVGPEGVHKSWRLALYPDVLLKRTQLRDMIDTDPKLRRALEITSEMAQMQDYWPDMPEHQRIDPVDLYARLKDMGYDWDILLDTRGYWTFDHYTHPINPLSTMDLINMYNGEYVPFWYEKGKIDTSKAVSGGSKDESSES